MITGKTVTLEEYLNRSYLEPPKDASPMVIRFWSLFGPRSRTITESVAAAVKLEAALSPYGVTVRHPSEMNAPFFENDSVILFGGPYTNPWMQLFEDRLNFRTVVVPDSALSEIQNLHPMPGEAPLYVANSRNGLIVSYMRTAVLPNLGGSGHVVVIGGTRGASTEAGCSFLTRPESLAEILKRFGVSGISQLPPFELLLELKAFSRSPLNIRIVADRRLSGFAPRK
jgi:hypothetical protein